MHTSTLPAPIAHAPRGFATAPVTMPINEAKRLAHELVEANERINWLLDSFEVDVGGPNEAVYVLADIEDVRIAIDSMRTRPNFEIEARIVELTIKRLDSEKREAEWDRANAAMGGY